jgi:hypothetical protein
MSAVLQELSAGARAARAVFGAWNIVGRVGGVNTLGIIYNSGVAIDRKLAVAR